MAASCWPGRRGRQGVQIQCEGSVKERERDIAEAPQIGEQYRQKGTAVLI